ncbi:MAG: ion transporter [Anaerolineae bacterium]
MPQPNSNPAAEISPQQSSSNYDLFILALTLMSLVTMTISYLPFVQPENKEVAIFIDTLICVVFLFDFFRTLKNAPSKMAYLKWGWMDLLGSIPAFPALRIFRLVRFVRLYRILGQTSLRDLWQTFIQRPAQSSLLITVLLGIALLGLSSFFILTFETHGANGNITTADDAIWWTLVTVTTVGYGDFFPVTVPGRAVALLLMVGGITLFSVLTSYLSTSFISADSEDDTELLRQELAEVKQLLQQLLDERRMTSDERRVASDE